MIYCKKKYKMNNNSDKLEEIKICIICLENINNECKKEKMCKKCTFNIHDECLNKWYIKNKSEVCPICLNNDKNKINNVENNNEIEIFNMFKISKTLFFIIHTTICIFIIIFFSYLSFRNGRKNK